MGERDPTDINAFNMVGYSFGTSFPRFTLEAAQYGNSRVPAPEMPANYYEPRIDRAELKSVEKVHSYIDQSVRFGRLSELFIHPHYISDVICSAAQALAALDEAIGYIREKNYAAVMSAPDEVARRWQERAAVALSERSDKGFTAFVPGGIVTARIPCDIDEVYIDGNTVKVGKKTFDGLEFGIIILPGHGRYRVDFVV